MHVVADTEALVADGIITAGAAREIETRSRQVMMTLAINAVLCLGILFATFGLIFWLADALSVAIVGTLLLVGGLVALARTPETFRMFGNAASLIGSGMLMGGAAIELLDKYPQDFAGWTMVGGGLLVALIAGRSRVRGGLTHGFVAGSIFLMGVALHLTGIGTLIDFHGLGGWSLAGLLGYAALAIGFAGWVTDVRLVTALAILPFAQMLETGTGYFGALYAFWSPEPTLTILQMASLVAVMVLLSGRTEERTARHARILAIMGLITANLSALVGSLFGDTIGQHIWGPGRYSWRSEMSYDAYNAALEAFEATAIQISENVYSVLWAIALAALIWWAAHTNRRGLFNAGVTFAAIHAYTQMFETFGDEPLAYVIGGFALIPLAWIMYQLNQRFLERQGAVAA